MISRTMHSLAYDSVHDEIVVNSPLAQAILMFRGGANGEEPPARFIQGPHTQIQGTDYDGNDKMTFDEVHGEIIIPVAGPKVLVFSRESNGDAAPIRVLAGPDTQIRGSRRGHPLVGVDPVNDLLIVGSTGGEGGGRDSDSEGARGRRGSAYLRTHRQREYETEGGDPRTEHSLRRRRPDPDVPSERLDYCWSLGWRYRRLDESRHRQCSSALENPGSPDYRRSALRSRCRPRS